MHSIVIYYVYLQVILMGKVIKILPAYILRMEVLFLLHDMHRYKKESQIRIVVK